MVGAGSGSAAGPGGRTGLVPDPGVEECVGEIDEKVQGHHHRGDDQVHRLHHRIVQAGEGLEEEEPDAGQAEDRLDDHRAADVERDLQSDQADHRDHRVLERVPQDDRPLGRPFDHAVRM